MGNYLKNNVSAALILALVFMLFLAVSPAGARVSGTCSDCHTMHDSQGGLSMRLGNAGEYGALGTECFDCHATLRPEIVRYD